MQCPFVTKVRKGITAISPYVQRSKGRTTWLDLISKNHASPMNADEPTDGAPL
jgi:hypothetical protein